MAVTGAGRHAARDGSFRRSVLFAAGRATLLVGAAVVLGIVLLQATDKNPSPKPSGASRAAAATTTTSRATTRTTVRASTTTTAGGSLRKPSQVRVVALNASGKNGVAKALTDRLAKSGYQMAAPGTVTPVQKQTIVYFKPGFNREAAALASVVGGTVLARPLPTPPPFAGTENVDCAVVIGSG